MYASTDFAKGLGELSPEVTAVGLGGVKRL